MIKSLLLALAYLAAGWFGLKIPSIGAHITLVWLPTGIAVAALLLWGRGVWPGVYLGALLTNLAIGSAWPLAAGIAVGNTLAPLHTVSWLKRVGFHLAFDRQRDVGVFIAAAGLGMVLSASGGIASLYLAGLMPLASMGGAWLMWWMGDTVGVLLATPMLLSLNRKNMQLLIKHRGEFLLWVLIACPTAWLVFIYDYSVSGQSLPLAFLTLPLFVWAALRFGNMGAALAGLSFSVAAAWGTATAHGTFYMQDVHISLFLLWSYMATTVLTGLLITALQSERSRVAQTLRRENEKSQVLLRNASDGIHILDMNGNLVEFSDSFCTMLGYYREEMTGMNVSQWDAHFPAAELPAGIRRQYEKKDRSLFETRHRGKDGCCFDVEISCFPLELDGKPVMFYSSRDITERMQAEDEIKYLAFYDPLTHLPNRRLLTDRLKQAIAASARSGRKGALLFIDLDNFKTLNDSLGHDQGDLLLRQVAQRLVGCIRESDTVARFGGDEFVVMLVDLSDGLDEAATLTKQIGEKILAVLNQVYQLGNHPHHSSSSIGATLFTGNQDSMDELLKQADLAMYKAKGAGRNVMRFFDLGMQSAITARAALENELRSGIPGREFVLYYQAQVDSNGRVTGAEALVRWQHPQRGLVSPLEFIPVAEETGLILPLGLWVLETACIQLTTWVAQQKMTYFTMSINISTRQFQQPDFVQQVLAVIDSAGVNPGQLKLELTESVILGDVEDIVAKMTTLKAYGVRFSLDDFGTGYSSLAYLKRLPLDQLKIDQSFVRDVLTDTNAAAIAQTVVALAQSLDLSVIAEGVETQGQQVFLASVGCHAYQGYLFSRPLPVTEFDQFMQQFHD
ncbi:MAG: EAL domain-containing protein [Sulfuriferula sp.]